MNSVFKVDLDHVESKKWVRYGPQMVPMDRKVLRCVNSKLWAGPHVSLTAVLIRNGSPTDRWSRNAQIFRQVKSVKLGNRPMKSSNIPVNININEYKRIQWVGYTVIHPMKKFPWTSWTVPDFLVVGVLSQLVWRAKAQLQHDWENIFAGETLPQRCKRGVMDQCCKVGTPNWYGS